MIESTIFVEATFYCFRLPQFISDPGLIFWGGPQLETNTQPLPGNSASVKLQPRSPACVSPVVVLVWERDPLGHVNIGCGGHWVHWGEQGVTQSLVQNKY